MKINIIMPTYNDSKTIIETLDTIKKQTYNNWNLFIVNDGSVDETDNVVKNYIEKNKLEDKIIYIYQKNSDQLNAIKKGLKYIQDKDSLVYVLHSDDLLANENVFQNVIDYFNNHKEVDAIISDYEIINEKSEVVGYQKVKKYNNKESIIALQGLWLGRNLFVDVTFCKYDIYKKYVFENYLTWNRPFWLNIDDKINMLKVQNVEFPFFKYRVFEENYINNEIGLLNVLNGELRTALSIFNFIDIPMYKFQYLLFRIFNKLHLSYNPLYYKKRREKIYDKIKFIINKRISDEEIIKYPYYNAILNFFKNIDNDKKIKIIDIKNSDVFLGSDVRAFNKKMLNKELPKIYYDLFKKMNKGFKIIVTDKNSYNNLVKILKFLDIYDYVNIIKK